jgi:hypothetical protein
LQKETVADAGDEDVLFDPFERITRKYARLIAEDGEREEGPDL